MSSPDLSVIETGVVVILFLFSAASWRSQGQLIRELLQTKSYQRSQDISHGAGLFTCVWLILVMVGTWGQHEGIVHELELWEMWLQAGIQLMVAGMLAILIRPSTLTSHQTDRLDLDFESCRWASRKVALIRGVWLGWLAYAPTILLLFALSPWRDQSSQHELLQTLARSSDPGIWLTVWVSAVMIAPLSEELLFRVVFQGWLLRFTSSQRAWWITACCFAAVHGRYDWLPLLPLALLLGAAYLRWHDYRTIVVGHATFNAIMLCLQSIHVWLMPGS